MKSIAFEQIREAVTALFQRANFELSEDMCQALRAGRERETSPLARNTLTRILQNAQVSRTNRLPMCQDTGLVVVFAKVGQEVQITGGSFNEAINAGIRQATREHFLRASVTPDPVLRGNTGDNTPAVIHIELIEGDKLQLQLLAKGGGCENMSRFRMLTPAEGRSGIVEFVLQTTREAGPNACPPIIVGVGLGGSFEYSAVLSKKALLRRIGERSTAPHLAELEEELIGKINSMGIGPQGYGGKTTSLAVHVEAAACHVASLPVSVNIECHAHRHQHVEL